LFRLGRLAADEAAPRELDGGTLGENWWRGWDEL
jgi:hypothetical protein